MPGELLFGIYIFVLSAFAGFEVISKVPPILHTPLMSGANAISGIAIVGALLITAPADTLVLQIIGFLAVVLATINIVGGFMATDRMLLMFKGRSEGASK